MEAPTIDGASELENKYGLDFCLRTSIISFLPYDKLSEKENNNQK